VPDLRKVKAFAPPNTWCNEVPEYNQRIFVTSNLIAYLLLLLSSSSSSFPLACTDWELILKEWTFQTSGLQPTARILSQDTQRYFTMHSHPRRQTMQIQKKKNIFSF